MTTMTTDMASAVDGHRRMSPPLGVGGWGGLLLLLLLVVGQGRPFEG